MAKITINDVSSGFISTTALNANFNALEDELNNKVLYRNNPTGEPNQMYQDLDMNGYRILNVLATSGEGFLWKGQWLTTTAYVLNNLVFQAGSTYICKVNHTSGTFATDLSANKWQLFAQQGNPGAGTGDMLASNNLSELSATHGTARANIQAAKSGANSDITSLLSLTSNPTVPGDATGTHEVVPKQQLDSGLASLVPAGAIIPFARNSPPTGWLEANGSAISRTTYSVLFAAIGTTFGTGDGSTTFNLPNLRGEFIRGWDNGRGVDSGRTFGSAQAEETKSHTHTASETSAGAHTHTTLIGSSGTGGGLGSLSASDFSVAQSTGSAGAHTHTITVNATGGTETRPRNIALLFCIKT